MMIFSIDNSHSEDMVELVVEEEGPFEVTFLTPKSRLPVITTGSFRETELALLARRREMDAVGEEYSAAVSSGNAKALERAQKRTREASSAWWELELSFASMLLRWGIPLKDRSMIRLKP